MKIIEVIKKPRYFVLAVISSVVMAIIYAYSQVLGIAHNVDVWFASVPRINLIIYFIFSFLFGITFSFQVYTWLQPNVCSVSKKAKGAGIGGIGTLGLFLVAQCPACASLGILLLPLSAVTFIARYSIVINLIGMGMLLFTINYLGGFKKE